MLEDIFHRSPYLLHQISTDRSQRLENCGCFFLFWFCFFEFLFVPCRRAAGGQTKKKIKKIPFRKGIKTMRICQWLCQIKQKSDVI